MLHFLSKSWLFLNLLFQVNIDPKPILTAYCSYLDTYVQRETASNNCFNSCLNLFDVDRNVINDPEPETKQGFRYIMCDVVCGKSRRQYYETPEAVDHEVANDFWLNVCESEPELLGEEYCETLIAINQSKTCIPDPQPAKQTKKSKFRPSSFTESSYRSKVAKKQQCYRRKYNIAKYFANKRKKMKS